METRVGPLQRRSMSMILIDPVADPDFFEGVRGGGGGKPLGNTHNPRVTMRKTML